MTPEAAALRQFGGDEFGGIKAFHGSPHSFDKFSMDAIGTGEGAQAYGHGLYFAENEGIARSYRDALAKGDPNDPVFNVYDLVKNGLPPQEARKIFQEIVDDGATHWPEPKRAERLDFARRTLEALDSGAVDKYTPPGSMYEVNINADPADFLDSDLPLSKQPEAVRRALEPVIASMKDARMNEFDRKAILSGKASGADLYGALKHSAPGDGAFDRAAAATDAIRSRGIPGIRYLDAGSRTPIQSDDLTNLAADIDRRITNAERDITSMPAGDAADYRGYIDTLKAERKALQRKLEPSRNFVIFDENLIDIVRKYGIAGAAAMLGASQADVAQAMQQQRPQGLLSGPQ
jgi:hypothetical protein